MAHTQDAILYDQSGHLCMIVIPDDDAQLDDPAFNNPDWTHLRVSRLDGGGVERSEAQTVAPLWTAVSALTPMADEQALPVASDATSLALQAAASAGVSLSLAPAAPTTYDDA